jgi:hypothetical protein
MKLCEQEAVEIRRTQEEIFQLDIFKRVGALKSSSRDRALGKTNFKKTHRKIEKLRQPLVPLVPLVQVFF